MEEKEIDSELDRLVIQKMDERKSEFRSEKEFEDQKEVLRKIFAEGKTPQEATQLDDVLLETLYGYGYHLYNNGQYEKAILLFQLLITLNPDMPKYYLGLAASLHMSKDYEMAAGTYMLCAGMEPDSPIPYYHASDCYQKVNDLKAAYLMMKLAWKRMENNPKYQKLKDRTEMKLEGLYGKILKEEQSGTKEKAEQIKSEERK